MTAKYENLNLCYHFYDVGIFIGLLLFFVSLFTLTAISVDRLLALLLGIRYRQVVTCLRVLLSVICFWTLSFCLLLSGFLSYKVISYYSSIAILLCLIVSTCCYTKIYFKLLHHQAQIHVRQGQPNGHAPLNIARYRKTVYSALWVQFSVIACYLPTGIVSVLMAAKGFHPSLIVPWAYSTTFLFSNSTLNPILYCWKIKEVRRAAMDIFKQIICCL